MTIYEILSFNKELLQRLFNAGVKTSDCLYVDLFNDYIRMRNAGNKTTYIGAVRQIHHERTKGVRRYPASFKGLQERCSVIDGKYSFHCRFLWTFAANNQKSCRKNIYRLHCLLWDKKECLRVSSKGC